MLEELTILPAEHGPKLTFGTARSLPLGVQAGER
jgi:hypothetical protein